MVGVLLLLVFLPVNFFFSAFTLETLWNWFVVPATGWAEISLWLAAGLGVVGTFFIASLITNKAEPEEAKGRSFTGRMLALLLRPILTNCFLLLSGWAIHYFMVADAVTSTVAR